MGSSHGFVVAVSAMLTAAFLVRVSEAYQFHVGGKQGWVVQPKEKYSHWAERLRFQVNDTLYFKYEKGTDSVLVVNKSEYYYCNASSPVQSLTEGNSLFRFDRSGPFFFISGFADHCTRGQKLLVVVLSDHHHHKKSLPPSPAPSSVRTSPPPSPSPPTDVITTTPPAGAPTPVANINSGDGVALRFTAGASLAGLAVAMVLLFN